MPLFSSLRGGCVSGLRGLPALVALAWSVHAPAAAADDHEVEEAEPRHHLSLVVGATRLDATDETAFTLGADYEYRVNHTLGLGVVVEQAFDALDSTSVLAVADIHLWHGLALQTGPGIEFAEGEELALARLGVLYEFELGDHFTAAPQLHYDLSEGEDAMVFGVAIGRAF